MTDTELIIAAADAVRAVEALRVRVEQCERYTKERLDAHNQMLSGVIDGQKSLIEKQHCMCNQMGVWQGNARNDIDRAKRDAEVAVSRAERLESLGDKLVEARRTIETLCGVLRKPNKPRRRAKV